MPGKALHRLGEPVGAKQGLPDSPGPLQIGGLGAGLRLVQQLRRQHTGPAVIEDPVINLSLHRFEVAVTLIGTGISPSHPHQMHPKAPQLFHQPGIGLEIKRPAIAEHPVDPPLEQRWHGPPVDRIDQYQSISAIDPGLLGENVHRRGDLGSVYRNICSAETRLEAFAPEIGKLEGVLRRLGQAFGNLPGKAVGQGPGVVMGKDKKCVHGDYSHKRIALIAEDLYTFSKLQPITYLWYISMSSRQNTDTSPRRRLTREQRLQQLMGVAWQIVREQGTEALTLGHLAEQAGVTKPVVYDHFDTRAVLLAALYQDYDQRQTALMEQALETARPTLAARADVIAASYMDCVQRQGREIPGVIAALASSPELEQTKREYEATFLETCRGALEPFANGAVIGTAGLRAMLGAAKALSHAATQGEISFGQAQEELCDTIVAMVERARARQRTPASGASR